MKIQSFAENKTHVVLFFIAIYSKTERKYVEIPVTRLLQILSK